MRKGSFYCGGMCILWCRFAAGNTCARALIIVVDVHCKTRTSMLKTRTESPAYYCWLVESQLFHLYNWRLWGQSYEAKIRVLCEWDVCHLTRSQPVMLTLRSYFNCKGLFTLNDSIHRLGIRRILIVKIYSHSAKPTVTKTDWYPILNRRYSHSLSLCTDRSNILYRILWTGP